LTNGPAATDGNRDDDDGITAVGRSVGVASVDPRGGYDGVEKEATAAAVWLARSDVKNRMLPRGDVIGDLRSIKSTRGGRGD